MANSNICYIPLSGKNADGRRATVDADLYDRLSSYSWCCNDDGYVIRSEPITNRNIRMHHDVIGFPPPGYEVDHRNGDTLDNRRSNLRMATKEQQMQNRLPWGEIEYKGVCLDKGSVKASMKIDGVQIYLGPYPSEVAAALAYDAMANHFYGEYARLNFPWLVPMPPEMALKLRTKNSQNRTPNMYDNIIAKLEQKKAA